MQLSAYVKIDASLFVNSLFFVEIGYRLNNSFFTFNFFLTKSTLTFGCKSQVLTLSGG